MKISAIIQKIVSEKTAVLIRPRQRINPSEPWEYDVKDMFTGKKKGWILLDLFTASRMQVVKDALKPESQEKFDAISLMKLVNFCMKA